MKHTYSVLLSALLVSACAGLSQQGPSAHAQLTATKGNATTGQVTFTQSGDSVMISGSVSGLKPNAEHGFHIHEKGDCSSGDGMSTGGHFNPLGKGHGQHAVHEHHAGDLPSLKADANGQASFAFHSKTISVGAGATDVIGRGLIVHRDPDDYKTQPTGNAGPRIACAVISKK
ncbi:MAG: hypothetical protein RLZZ502_1679 [Pseudomonadota bacterium]